MHRRVTRRTAHGAARVTMTGSASPCARTRNGARCALSCRACRAWPRSISVSVATPSSAIDAALTAWAGARSAPAAAEALLKAGIPAAALARHADLVQSPHLAARAFWDRHGAGVLPGLPWRASFGRTIGPAPELGADADHVLADVLGLSPERIAELRTSGVLGSLPAGCRLASHGRRSGSSRS